MENKKFDILSGPELHAVMAGNGVTGDITGVQEVPMVKDSSVT